MIARQAFASYPHFEVRFHRKGRAKNRVSEDSRRRDEFSQVSLERGGAINYTRKLGIYRGRQTDAKSS
jgi:hypothetical protein